jgi:hypothetical protein
MDPAAVASEGRQEKSKEGGFQSLLPIILSDIEPDATQCSTTQHSTAQHSTAQHSTAQHNIAQ